MDFTSLCTLKAEKAQVRSRHAAPSCTPITTAIPPHRLHGQRAAAINTSKGRKGTAAPHAPEQLEQKNPQNYELLSDSESVSEHWSINSSLPSPHPPTYSLPDSLREVRLLPLTFTPHHTTPPPHPYNTPTTPHHTPTTPAPPTETPEPAFRDASHYLELKFLLLGLLLHVYINP